MNREYKEHPSYGNIVLTKPTQGPNGATLFGSKVKHPSYISLEINHACISEDGFSEFIHGRKPIIKVDMSEAQWAGMVSSFGSGAGTPVTLHWTKEDGYIESPPDAIPVIDVAKKTANDVTQKLAEQMKTIEKNILALVDKGFGKKDLKAIAFELNILASHLTGNLEYLEECVVESMEKEVAKAQIEIEAIVSNVVQRLGDRALGSALTSGEITNVKSLLQP